MVCGDCGATNQAGARFCSGCGHRMEPAPAPAAVPGPRVLAFTCPRCGQTVPPETFFSRGFNLFKLVLLFPISFVLPLIYFFLRKDRLLCGHCQKLLPAAASPLLLPAAEGGHAGSQALVPAHAYGLLAHPSSGAAMALHRRAGRSRAAAIGLGALGGMAALPVAVVGMFEILGLPELMMLAMPAGFFGVASALLFRRGGKLTEEAKIEEARFLHQRVLQLARAHKGRLTVTEVASALGLDLKDAELLLDGMVDGERIDLEITEDGRVFYAFHELAALNAAGSAG